MIQFVDQKNKTSVEFRHDGGVVDFLDAINRQRNDQRVAPLPFVLEREDEDDGLRCHLALAWTEATDEDIRSFVNTIPTRDGGTHELGMLAAVGTAVQRFMETHDLVKKGMEIKREDIREGLTAVLAVCVREPQFQGQTKGRLNNPEVKAQVESMIRPALENFLLKNQERGRRDRGTRDPGGQGPRGQPRRRLAGPPQDGDQRPAQSARQARTTATAPTPTNRSSSSSRATAPAARPSKGRDRDIQAILPLKGKVLNAEQAGKAKVLDNKELTDIVSALGCGMDDQYDPGRLRYGKVILLTDADSDGHHIATLLLTFFYRHVPGPVRRRPDLSGLPAALQDRLGQGDLLGLRRRRPRPDPGQASQERQAQSHPFQGTGRDARAACCSRRPSTRPAAGCCASSSPTTIAPTPNAPSATSWARSPRPASSSSWRKPTRQRTSISEKAAMKRSGRRVVWLVVALVVALGLGGAAVGFRHHLPTWLSPKSRPAAARAAYASRDWQRALDLARGPQVEPD